MGRGRIAALILAALVIGVALTRTATASHTSSHKAFSGGATFRGLVVKTDSTSKDIPNSTQTVDSRGFSIPAGESQLIVVDFSAVTDCTAGCFVRARVARTAGSPLTLEPSSGGAFTAFAHANSEGLKTMTKALCVRNATGSPLNVTVWVEALASPGENFTLHEWVFKIARNAPCDPAVNI